MKKIITIAIFFLLTSTANAQFWGSGVYNPPVASTQTFSSIPANTATDVQTAIKNVSTYDFYDHTSHSVYSGVTSTGAAWTVCPTCEVSLWTTTIPGGTMGQNGIMRIDPIYIKMTNASSNKTINVKFGGTAFITSVFTTAASVRYPLYIQNNNSTSSQSGHGFTGSQSFLSVTGGVNTNNNQSFSITAQTALESSQTPTSSSSGDGATCTVTILPSHGYNSDEYIKSAGGSNCTTSGNPNGDPVKVTKLSATQFTYPCTCSGDMQSTFPTINRYSVIQLESIDGSIKYRP